MTKQALAALRIAWRAHDARGVGHALPKGALRYLCNRMPINERYAWPVTSKCDWCLKAIEEVAA